MKKFIMALVCLMTMVVSVNAHNVHYPTYTEDGITYVKAGTTTYDSEFGGRCEPWDVKKVDKPYSRTITIPHVIMVNGEKIRVDAIRENAFETCISLDSLIICDGVWINDNAFRGCKQLDYLYYSAGGFRSKNYSYQGLYCRTLETTCGISEDPFWRQISSSLEKLIIKDTNTFHNRMDYCTNLKTIICYAITPPYTQAAKSISNYIGGCYVSFESWQWATVILYVPRESLEKYYFDRVWGEIDNIYAIDEYTEEVANTTEEVVNTNTSINSISNDTIEDDVWYSLNGTKVNKPTKGMYIKNGKKYIIN